MKITLIKAKTDLGVHVDGANLSPSAIYDHFINDIRINEVIDIEKNNIEKNKDINNLEKNLDEINNFNEKLYNSVKLVREKDYFPIILGGDHSLSIGSALGSIKNKQGIIWIDSHGDYNTLETTKTGNIHGLPLAAINELNKNKLSAFHNGNYYKPENTVIVGGRDIDKWEKPNIEKMGVTLFTTQDIKEQGIETIIKKAIDIASKNTEGIHISFDIDVIDPTFAPGVSVPAKDGISDIDSYKIIDEVLKYQNNINSIDLVEFNPTKDKNNKTETIATTILEKIITSIHNKK